MDLASLQGQGWKYDWEAVPDHLKERVRDGVFRYWGSLLTFSLLQHVRLFPQIRSAKELVIAALTDKFLVSPAIILPGDLLPAVANATSLRVFHQSGSAAANTTSLRLTYAGKISDQAVATFVQDLVNLDHLNLKGCTSVGERTVNALLKRCQKLRRINPKGTKVNEEAAKQLLDQYGHQLESFKVDQVHFSVRFLAMPSS